MAMAQARLSTANRRREMECAVCLDRLRQPKTLSCQHNFCGECLEGLVQDQRISCPTCRKETTLGPGGVGDLPKNTALISIMESFCEQCLNRDREVCCDHCGLWMCSQCHNSCEREQDIAKQWKAFMGDLNEQQRQIFVNRSKMTETVESVMDQIDATEGRMIKFIRLGAKHLREEMELKLNEQLDIWDKLTTDINQLKTEISDFAKNRLKVKETSEIDIESLTGRWRDQVSSCQSEMAQANRLIEFVASQTTPSLGEIVVKLNQGSTMSTSLDQANIKHEKFAKGPDYEHAKLSHATFGSKGSAPGQFLGPSRIAIPSTNNNLIVLDHKNSRIQLFKLSHEFVSEFGSRGGGQGQFNFDSGAGGLCVTDDGLIVVADTGNHRLQLFTKLGEHVRSIGSNGSGPGQFDMPRGLDIDRGLIYVCDTNNYRIQVLEVGGKFVQQFGSKDVFGDAHPFDITIDQNGDIYVIGDTKLFVFTRKGESKGAINTDSITLQHAVGVTTDGMGHIFITDYRTHKMHILSTNGKHVRTVGSEEHGPGQLQGPVGIACGQDGHIFVADWGSHSVKEFFV